MYVSTPTGLAPETIEFNGIGDMRVKDRARFYALRPETLESFFVLHQLTGDPVYREWGWDIFEAIERHCRVGVGYGSHPDVEVSNRNEVRNIRAPIVRFGQIIDDGRGNNGGKNPTTSLQPPLCFQTIDRFVLDQRG